eukprot:CAMPEP_0170633496 /NCGR_PEP_ID=MMETSP0224-20130122/36026_1 /TAXON_ID=285029 /ORGANISM="Togula jolla, Strain CCCM 725" /LENGTH=191 /DNA_ID=CAMNT_0010962547 /DNA_START=41 /DNA_END=612 /DNA_ORIENTATION=-
MSGALSLPEDGAESDNSVKSKAEPEVDGNTEGADGADGGDGGTGGDGVAFFDVQTACPGGDEVPELKDGETALAEALPMAEALDEVALDFVAPLVALFGDGWIASIAAIGSAVVAALFHLSSSMGRRLEDLRAHEASPELGELLDGAMRTVHEGLGDQNIHVYAEACRAVTAVVPTFCGAVDGRLLVAHLA